MQVHGARASLKTWATAKTHHRREIIELTLAHAIGDAVEKAYFRDDDPDVRTARSCYTAIGAIFFALTGTPTWLSSSRRLPHKRSVSRNSKRNAEADARRVLGEAIARFKADNPGPRDDEDVATVLIALEDAIHESKGTDWKTARAFAAINALFRPSDGNNDASLEHNESPLGTRDLTLIDVCIRAARLKRLVLIREANESAAQKIMRATVKALNGPVWAFIELLQKELDQQEGQDWRDYDLEPIYSSQLFETPYRPAFEYFNDQLQHRWKLGEDRLKRLRKEYNNPPGKLSGRRGPVCATSLPP